MNRRPGSREEDAWLSDEQLARCAPAETEPFCSPVPTRMVSNGEYMPCPQTEKQKRVEARIKELADSASKKLGMSRRKFLAGTGGLAAAFLAMNEVFGRIFNVSPIEMFEPAAYAATGTPSNLFVFDDQTHLVRSSQNFPNALRAMRRGRAQRPRPRGSRRIRSTGPAETLPVSTSSATRGRRGTRSSTRSPTSAPSSTS